jgi:hypothetical protein
MDPQTGRACLTSSKPAVALQLNRFFRTSVGIPVKVNDDSAGKANGVPGES